MSHLIDSMESIKAAITTQSGVYSANDIDTNLWIWSPKTQASHAGSYPINDIASLAAEVYSHTYTDRKDTHVAVGRLADTIKLAKTKTPFDDILGLGAIQDSQGSVQKLKLWSQCVNDCWVFGGICARRPFKLVSSVADAIGNGDTVTLTEMAALKVSGYKKHIDGGNIFFTSPATLNFSQFLDFVRARKDTTNQTAISFLTG